MKSKREKIDHLLNKANWSNEERKWMLQYLEENNDAQLKSLMKERFDEGIDFEEHHNIEASKLLLQSLYKNIGINEKGKLVNKSLRHQINRVRVAGAAAAAIGLIIFCAYLFQDKEIQQVPLAEQLPHIEEEVITWGNKAILTLEDGKVINLDDISNGEVVKQGGVLIRKTADGKISYETDPNYKAKGEVPVLNTMSTPRGGEYQVVLPDGSQVWLNAASSLTYPIQFSATSRVVTIEGEAYFEIAKDTNRPFIVNVDEVEIRVLGTHFNVSAYKEESEIKTTLLEGSVQVKRKSLTHETASIIMRPGDQAIVSDGQSSIKMVQVDIDDVMAWRHGYFVFHKEGIHSAMNKIGRWYDLDIEFEGNLRNRRFEGTISRMENLNSLVKALELTGVASFKLEGRKIVVKE
jgi:hypothetical protein